MSRTFVCCRVSPSFVAVVSLSMCMFAPVAAAVHGSPSCSCSCSHAHHHVSLLFHATRISTGCITHHMSRYTQTHSTHTPQQRTETHTHGSTRACACVPQTCPCRIECDAMRCDAMRCDGMTLCRVRDTWHALLRCDVLICVLPCTGCRRTSQLTIVPRLQLNCSRCTTLLYYAPIYQVRTTGCQRAGAGACAGTCASACAGACAYHDIMAWRMCSRTRLLCCMVMSHLLRNMSLSFSFSFSLSLSLSFSPPRIAHPMSHLSSRDPTPTCTTTDATTTGTMMI